MRAKLDQNKCRGCGMCEIICPEVFRIEQSNPHPKATLLTEDVPPEALCFAWDTWNACPANAIKIEIGETERINIQ